MKQILGSGFQTSYDTIRNTRGNGRKWDAALAARTTAAPARLVIFGDSVTEGLDGSYVEAFKKRLAPYNNWRTSAGWVHGSQDVANVFNAYKLILTTGTANSPAGQNVEDAHAPSTSGWKLASGSVISLEQWVGPLVTDYAVTSSPSTGPEFDTIEFHYTVFGTSGAAGSLTVAIDGVSQTAINTVDVSVGTGNYECRTVTYSTTRGAHAVTITGSGGQPSIVGGMYLSDGDTVYTYAWGNSGTKLSDFYSTSSGQPIQAATYVNADCVLWAHGINDYGDGVATSATNLNLALSRTASAVSDVSLGYILPYPTSTRTDWGLYEGTWRGVCSVLNVPVCDNGQMLKTNASTTDPRDLIHDAGSIAHTHPNPAGAEYIADSIARFLGIPSFDWSTAATALFDLPEKGFPSGVLDMARIRAVDETSITKIISVLPDGNARYISSSIRTDMNPFNGVAPSTNSCVRETSPRAFATITNLPTLLTSGQVYLVSIPLVTYEIVTNITFVSGTTAAGTPTHWWFFLATTGRVVQRFTADQTTTAWGADTAKTLALSSPYTVSVSGNYYLGIMVTATTTPSLRGVAGDSVIAGLTPILQGNSSTTGQTTVPGSLTAGSIATPSGNRPYAYVT